MCFCSILKLKKEGERVQSEFSALLKKARKNAGLTQKELASILGVATGTVQQWELGTRFPRVTMLKTIEDKLDVALVPTVIEEGAQHTVIYLNHDDVKACQKRKFDDIFEQLNSDNRDTAINRLEEILFIQTHMQSQKAKELSGNPFQPSPGESSPESSDK